MLKFLLEPNHKQHRVERKGGNIDQQLDYAFKYPEWNRLKDVGFCSSRKQFLTTLQEYMKSSLGKKVENTTT
ncbi:hypothetical protein Y032_0387g468 [Ancylostoma ceylanicum]|uniref:Uncharacterized protein n=1 Tax=Ancylostoma ceylanicum TaxID=53326 RepID=A0A016RSJ5_9BILA|nr:hypothetical protein Y032_0387g468 [Ancylostoma ceylanicum]